jgi:helicase
MIDNDGAKIWATEFGHRVSQLYIDPLSAVILRDGLKVAEENEGLVDEVAYFQLLASTPDLRNLYLRKKDEKELRNFLWEFNDTFLGDTPEEWEPDFEYFLMGVKTALLLNDWIEEKSEESLILRFNTGSGDILYITDSAKWLLYASIEIAKLFNLTKIRKKLRELHIRVANGIKKELVPLVKLQGIGRVRGRLLYNNGFKTIAALRKADPRELTGVPSIGRELVRKIKEQVGEEIVDQELKFS